MNHSQEALGPSNVQWGKGALAIGAGPWTLCRKESLGDQLLYMRPFRAAAMTRGWQVCTVRHRPSPGRGRGTVSPWAGPGGREGAE